MSQPSGSVMTHGSLWLASLFLILLPLVAAAGEDSPLTTITPEGGSIRQEGNRVDVFTSDGQREGYGIRRGDGSWDLFRKDSSRLGLIERGIAGQPGRITITPGKK